MVDFTLLVVIVLDAEVVVIALSDRELNELLRLLLREFSNRFEDFCRADSE